MPQFNYEETNYEVPNYSFDSNPELLEEVIALINQVDELNLEYPLSYTVDSTTSESQLEAAKILLKDTIREGETAAVFLMGRCPMDYAWRLEGEWYCCEGGTHFVHRNDIHRYMREN